VSTMSTPRGSVDVPSMTLSSEAALDSPGSNSSRHHSLVNSRMHAAGVPGGSTPNSARSRLGSGTGDDVRPTWMRRPGGVGSLGRNVRTPGPEKDSLNQWAKKHLPGLNIDYMPSMSVMGSETARFGFNNAEDNAGIVESPFEEGRDVLSTSRQGSGLDKAAAAIETWLRGAFAKRPGTPILGPRGRPVQEEGDLIELAETSSDDGRGNASGTMDWGESGLLSQGASAYGSSGRSDGDGTVRGRMRSSSAKSKKSD
jgi:hypothetical protein